MKLAMMSCDFDENSITFLVPEAVMKDMGFYPCELEVGVEELMKHPPIRQSDSAPTQWAYDRVCATRTKWKARAVDAEAKLAKAEINLDNAHREPYRIIWDALDRAGITRADGCPDNILVEEIEDMRAKAEKAESEARALREALEELVPIGDIAEGLSPCYIHSDTIKRARAALAASAQEWVAPETKKEAL